MARIWVRDINFQMFHSGRHWTEHVDSNSSDGIKDHPQWKRNLNDNVLMNFFRNADSPSDSLTFRAYYEGRIHTVLDRFRRALDTIPMDEILCKDELGKAPCSDPANEIRLDPDERISVRKENLESAAQILRDAINEADGDFEELKMKQLYTTDFYDEPQLGIIVTTLKRLHVNADGTPGPMWWLCIPFLKFKMDQNDRNDPGIDRPDNTELRRHIDGDGNANDANGWSGVGDFDYANLLFFPRTAANWDETFPDNQDNRRRSQRHFNARTRALQYGFLSGQEVDYLQNASIYRPKSNSNGRICQMISGVRYCIESGNPATYCVNNGTSYCP